MADEKQNLESNADELQEFKDQVSVMAEATNKKDLEADKKRLLSDLKKSKLTDADKDLLEATSQELTKNIADKLDTAELAAIEEKEKEAEQLAAIDSKVKELNKKLAEIEKLNANLIVAVRKYKTFLEKALKEGGPFLTSPAYRKTYYGFQRAVKSLKILGIQTSDWQVLERPPPMGKGHEYRKKRDAIIEARRKTQIERQKDMSKNKGSLLASSADEE